MTPALVALAVVVGVGAVVAMSARLPRLAILGALVALAGSAYVADPLPSPVALGARLAGTTLAAYLLWIAARGAPRLEGTGPGLPGSAALAGVAFLAGWLGAGTLGSAVASGAGDGPGAGALAGALASGSLVARAAAGAALALAAVAALPVLLPRDVLRLGLGLLLLIAGAGLLRSALAGSPDEGAELLLAVLTALAGAGVAATVSAGLRRGGDLVMRDRFRQPAIRHRPADEAHPAAGGGAE